MAGSRTPEVFLKTRHSEEAAVFSPDGQWIAYHSDSSGRAEVYVRPFPARDPFYKISTDGGAHPRWSGDGRELVWLAPDGALVAARFDATTQRKVADPQRLFPTLLERRNRAFDVSRDGQRFLVPIAIAEPLRVVLDWRAMLAP
jgi:hypothetical protein